jgi:hypothetical protein
MGGNAWTADLFSASADKPRAASSLEASTDWGKLVGTTARALLATPAVFFCGGCSM